MPAEILHLDDYRPHLVLDCTPYGGKVHVLPVELVRNWIKGDVDLPFHQPGLLKKIVSEWLMCVHQGYVERAQEELTG